MSERFAREKLYSHCHCRLPVVLLLPPLCPSPLSITPDHDQYHANRGGYSAVHSGGGSAYKAPTAVNHAEEEEDELYP